jgi:UDP-N-acetylglucosamine acyltransferase
MSLKIAPTAVIDPRAELGPGVEIGPFCVIGPLVTIGRGTQLLSHVTLMGRVTLGRFNRIFPFTVIGAEPQDVSYLGTDTQVILGDDNVIRESVTINRGTEKEEGITSLGDRCFLMAGCHVAHDCKLGNDVMLANATLLGGHVHVQNHAVLSGSVAVHHFTTIGSYSFVAGLSRVLHDVPPYMLVEGSPAWPRCVNNMGLKRNGFSQDDIRGLAEAHRLLYRGRVGLDHAREILRSNGMLLPPVNHLLQFIQQQHEGRHGRSRERRRAA